MIQSKFIPYDFPDYYNYMLRVDPDKTQIDEEEMKKAREKYSDPKDLNRALDQLSFHVHKRLILSYIKYCKDNNVTPYISFTERYYLENEGYYLKK